MSGFTYDDGGRAAAGFKGSAGDCVARSIAIVAGLHYTAVIDGIIHDTHDCSRDGSRCVYGYWRQA